MTVFEPPIEDIRFDGARRGPGARRQAAKPRGGHARPQVMDLVGRKLAMAGGGLPRDLFAELEG